jgi:tRNA-specific 2-thiouridylase
MPAPAIGVAVSGGVDSLVSAFLLKQQYKQVFGLHFTTGYEMHKPDINRLKDQLNMDIVTLDLSVPFEKEVIAYFVSTYFQGKTPNPCTVCNRKIKFGVLLDQAKKLGADYLATGHYAAIVNALTRPDTPPQPPRLEKAKDTNKDQSYFLARLSREQLASILCPLSGFFKDHVRALAAEQGLVPVVGRESQDVCFMNDKNLADFLTDKIGLTSQPGPIIDIHGRRVGTHAGVHAFTVGQRRGINSPAAEPYYVRQIDPATRTLHVCFKKDLAVKQMTVEQMVWHDDDPETVQEVAVKIRYRHKETGATLTRLGTTGRVTFKTPQYAVTPGQIAVFYRDRQVLGSAIIQ